MLIRTRSVAVIGAALLAAGALSACSSSETPNESASSVAACALTVSDPWVKATDTEMTGAFGVIANPGEQEVTITSATSTSAGMVEIHEVVDKDGQMVMQPKEGGLVVPAGGTAELKPGADHLMLMELPKPIEAGDEVEITAVCSTGGSVTWTSVAKPFEGGAESYEPEGNGAMESMPAQS